MQSYEVATEVCRDLIIELGIREENNRTLLGTKVKNAVREVKKRRNYPSHFSEDDIQKDLSEFYSNIHDLALYDYNQIGAEGQISHSDNGTSRTWKDREECLKGVFAWAGF